MADFPGTAGNDTYEGTADSDTISGGGGDDRLTDRYDGSDVIDGGDGADSIRLYRLYQTGGTVSLLGGAGNDTIEIAAYSNGALDLTVDAGDGDDRVDIWALRKAGTITLGAGRDVLNIDNSQSVYLGAETNITITDFVAGADGDRIEWDWFLTQALTGWDRESNPFSTGHLRLVQLGDDVALQIDRNGGGDAYGSFLTFADTDLASFTHHNFGGFTPDGTAADALVLTGTAADDTLRGGDGADTVNGFDGQDILFGGPGDDVIYGGGQHDRIDGGYGDDLIYGGGDSDNIVGSFGNDIAFGGLGNDFFENIEGGVDAFFGQEGNDFFWVEPAFFSTARDAYLIDGGIGDDSLTLDSYGASDQLNANMGDGADRIHFYIFRGTGTVTLGAGQDVIQLSGTTPYFPDTAVVVSDFAAGAAGDSLAWSPVLDTVAPTWDNSTNPFDTGFARLVQQGTATLLQIDKDGTATAFGFATLITLDNTDAAALDAFNLGHAPSAVTVIAAPAAEDDLFLTDEATAVTGNLFADNGLGADAVDAEGVLRVASVGGTPLAVGQPLLLESGATLTVDVRGNFTYDPTGLDYLAAYGTGGSNSQLLDSFTYTLAGGGTGTVTIDVRGLYSAPHNILGTNGDDVLTGTAQADIFAPGQVADEMTGGAGDDVYEVFDAGDAAIELAGEGSDEVRTTLGSKSDYSQLYVLPANVEKLTGLSISGLGQGVRGNALDNVVVMGGGGDLIVLDDGGDETVTAGGGNDYVYYGAAWTVGDSTDGGAGTDTIGLLGSYDLTLAAGSLVGIERLALYTGMPGGVGTANNYTIATVDSNVAAGAALFVTAASLQAGETFVFNGSAETDGRFSILSGAGNDIVAGGAKGDHIAGGGGADQLFGLGGRDTLVGGAGGDSLRGGAGNDTFRYESVTDSTAAATDRIADFGAGGDLDRIDLSAIDADASTAADDAFVFIGTNQAFSGAGGEVRAVQSNGLWFVEADLDGDMAADLVIRIDNGASHIFAASDFVL